MSVGTSKKAAVSSSRLRLALVGANGRMGKKVLEVLEDPQERELAASFSLIWRGSLRDPADLEKLTASEPDLIIDFSKPQGTLSWVRAFEKKGSIPKPAALICATGFGASETKYLKSVLGARPWALVPNTSLGVFSMTETLKVLATTLPPDYAFSVHESHHAQKVDSPSGTGLMLKALLQKLRPEGADIPISAVRGGSDPGTHTVTILGPFEKLVISHAAENRRLFARGALVLGRELVKSKKSGPLGVEDLLGRS